MLIRFGCSNYKSIYGYQELLFAASSLKDPQPDLINTSRLPDTITQHCHLWSECVNHNLVRRFR
ncbi:hypothetical protein [Methylocucumis oryzae]|uniref:hypothetical protein n=1 Tax=Methylocucumis oryzae TaxID=1632867 RepID=UPI001955289D|nr:hypothetical protein [Methylocucumis oryzae]